MAHLTGRFNNSGETPSVAMKLTGTDMPAADLESVLPAVGVTLPSSASLKEAPRMNVNLAINGPVNEIRDHRAGEALEREAHGILIRARRSVAVSHSRAFQKDRTR